jgi:hypothetical protein
MLYRGIIALVSEIHRKHRNPLCEQNVEFLKLNFVKEKRCYRARFVASLKLEVVMEFK